MPTFRILLFLLLGVLASCRNDRVSLADLDGLTPEARDSIRFVLTHHYTLGANFSLAGDSLQLSAASPSEALPPLGIDSATVYRDDELVVAQILPVVGEQGDTAYYLKVARDQDTMGWIGEAEFLAQAVPNDPISDFIYAFSHGRMLMLCLLLGLSAGMFLLRRLHRQRFTHVFVSGAPMTYPSLLCILTAVSATLYGSLQAFRPDMWQAFYFKPSLSPLEHPLLLGAFLLSVWVLVIMVVATAIDLFKWLRPLDALGSLFILGCVCLVTYLFFSLTVASYVAFPALAVYAVAFGWRMLVKRHKRYRCGYCNAKLDQLGPCPHCGAINK